MSNIIDFKTRKAEMLEAEKAHMEEQMQDFNAMMNRAKMKADNGKTISDSEAYAILGAMSGMALSKSPAWDDLTEEDFEGMVVYGAPKGMDL